MKKIIEIEDIPIAVPLETEAQAVCVEAAKLPRIYQLPPEQGRKVLDQIQDEPVYLYPAQTTMDTIDLDELGKVNVYYVVPDNIQGAPNIIFYIHGAGWVFGNYHTHQKLVRELAFRTNSVVVFPEYSLSPEAKYPIALEQCYAILNRLPVIAQDNGWDYNFDTLTVAGDSVGGNMATVMTLLTKYRGGQKINKQLLYYPVTEARFDTLSYLLFEQDYYLYRAGMMWFWDQYTSLEEQRNELAASPNLATIEDLQGLPPAMIINGEADVLRDEGEAYARKLRTAGVDVTAIRFQAIIHDFVMLNSLDRTRACRAAMDVSTDWINRKNHETYMN